MSTLSPAVRAFDRFAPRYDQACGGTLFRAMRARVHASLAASFAPGARVLEVGCGSGLDTAWLAARGVDVVATDPSAGMIEQARARIAALRAPGRVRFVCCGVDEVGGHLGRSARFTGLVSTFGALNCVATLDGFGQLASVRVEPGGRVMVCLMSRTCLAEIGWFLLRGEPRRAFRRLAPAPVAVDVEGIAVPIYYHRVREVVAALGEAWSLRRVRGLAVALPPPFLESRWAATPRVLRRGLEGLDALVSAAAPFNRLGDHTLMEFEDWRI